jgi:hypothetical protein
VVTTRLSEGTRNNPPVVGYPRVSTDRQAEEGLGLDVRRQAIGAWASASGFRVTAAWGREEQPSFLSAMVAVDDNVVPIQAATSDPA